MSISLIAAVDQNSGIGKDNKLPWNLPGDLQWFRKVTMGKTVVMGHNTFRSLGKKVLPGRMNVILSTRANEYQCQDCWWAKNMEEVLELVKDEEETFIIGGETLYRQFLPLASKLYITLIYSRFETDTMFPELQANEWTVESSQLYKESILEGVMYYRRIVYVRRLFSS